MIRLRLHRRILLMGISAFVLTFLYWSLANSTGTESLDADIQQILKLEADPDYGEYLAGECQTCHGGSQTTSGVPPIKSLPADYVLRALLEYKKLVRPSQVMQLVASGLGDEEMAALAAYFSTSR